MRHRLALRWALLPVLAVAIASGLELARSAHSPAPLAAAEWGRAGYGPPSYNAAWRRVSEQLELNNERVRQGPHEWLRLEGLARAYMARSRFAVTYDDLARADRLLAQAQSVAPPPSGPLLTRAVLGMMTHRLALTESALDTVDTWAVAPDAGEQVELLGLRGDVAFYRGDMAAAERRYAEAGGVGGEASFAYRRGNLAKARGDFDAALAQFRGEATSARAETPFQHASTALQIGAIEQARGNYAAAREWFAAADRQFPGYWLFQAHRAQSQAIAGDLPGAIAAMRRVAVQSPSAEVMDALAALLRAQGEARESRAWAARAGQEWERRLVQAPEAAYGHALEHELVFGSPERALDLARRNLAARPYGESRILLASAQLMNGDNVGALAQLERAEATGWRSAPLYALKTQVFELLRRSGEASTARAKALSLNPRIFAPETAFVWFSHG